MDIKDLILIGGGLLVAAIVAHGLWIAWRTRRDPLRLRIDEKLIAAVADREPVQADFPNGGARVITRWDDPVEPPDRHLESAARAAPATREHAAPEPASQERAPQERAPQERAPQERAPQERAPQERRDPSLGGGAPRSESGRSDPLVSGAGGGAPDGAAARRPIEPSAGSRPIVASRDRAVGTPREPQGGDAARPGATGHEPAAADRGTHEGAPRGNEPRGNEPRGNEPRGNEGEGPAAAGREGEIRPTATDVQEGRSEILVGESGSGKGEGLRAGVARRAQEAFKALGHRSAPKQPGAGSGRGTGSAADAGQAGTAADAPPEDLILINVLAPREQPFTGPNLVAALRANGLRYGDMNIFHRLDQTTRAHQYSVANVIEPGTFDMAEVDEFRTPGVCFFMRLPGPEHPLAALEDMHNVARDVAQRLGGELKDERRSVLTGQTVEHYRHRVSEFCRRRMSMRA